MKKTPLKRRNRKRQKSEWERAYHSKARVEFVKALPCTVPWCQRWPSENAHVETGGMGRKADYDKIVPLCRAHHRELHRGVETFEEKHKLRLRVCARTVDLRWQTFGDFPVEGLDF